MQERLQKILAGAGVASRREAEKIIASGRVCVNGVTVTEMGVKADPEKDTVTLDGKHIRPEPVKIYLMLNKPAGYVTTMKDPQGRRKVIELLNEVKQRVFPVGRLDYNTEGLLLFTNDGEWANILAHPRHEVDKEYLVRIRGKISPEQIRALSEGVELEEGKTAPAVFKGMGESEKNTWFSLTIHEGRYRQVRRMCEALELTVVRLKRSRYGFLKLGDLRPGEFRRLTDTEVAMLRKSGTKK